jgi:hypothetical protein
MPCPYLAYREAGDDRTFELARAYCTATEQFVQPMRADICNDRYEFDHETDCEFYREAEDLPRVPRDHGDSRSEHSEEES